jgi:hypothetical protein
MLEQVRRPVVRWILSGVFLLLSLNAFVQVVMHLLHMNTDPPALTALQLLNGSAAFMAAWTTWRGAPRDWMWSLVYGATGVLLFGLLGPILDLDREAVRGIWMGAAVIAAFSLWAAWYLRRTALRGSMHSIS